MHRAGAMAALLAAVAVNCAGCASLAKGFNQEVKVSSVPPGSKIYLDGVPTGVTPKSLFVQRSRGHTVIVESATGEQTGTTLTPHVNALFWVDLLMFWPAVFIDLGTGGMYNLDPPAVMALPGGGVNTGANAMGVAPVAGRPVVTRRMANLAVADLEAQGVSGTDAAVIGDVLRNRLINAGGLHVVEKKNMDKILTEQAFQQTGCTSQECAVKLGKLLNVQGMVVGSFGKLLGRYIVSVRVVEVESGSVVVADEAKGDTLDALEKGLDEMVIRVSRAVK